MIKEMLKKKYVLVIIILLILTSQDYIVFAHEKNEKFKHINVENGLSQVNVNNIFQDSQGYLWFGTSDGLNRYNGREFRIYKYRQNSNYSISNNLVRKIKEDSHGNIWVGTSAGLNKINTKLDETTMYLSRKNNCNISNDFINDIFLDSKGRILVATEDGLNLYNEESDNFIRLYSNNTPEYMLDSEVVYCIEEDDYGNYWIGTSTGLNKVDTKTGKIKKYTFENTSTYKMDNYGVSTLYFNGNTMWIGVRYGGLFKLDISTEKIEKVFLSNGNEDKNYLDIREIIKDKSGTIWLATEDGLGKYDINTGKFNLYRNKVYDNGSLSSNNLRSIIEGKSGLIWIGSNKGVDTFNPYSVFKQYKNDILDENSLSNNSLSGIYQDNEGLVWIGTVEDGLNVINRESNEVTRINVDTSPLRLSSNNVRKIVGIDNEIWIATENGLNKIDKITNELTIYGPEDGLTDTDVRSLYIDNEGILWIGTRTKILSFNRKDEIKDCTDVFKANGVVVDRVRDIIQDHDGMYWIATGGESGVVQFDKSLRIISVLNNFSKDVEDKGDDTIWSLTVDNEGYIWISTNCGIIKVDKKTGKYKRYTEEDGLSNNNVQGILVDDLGQLWISTYYGISKFDTNYETFIKYDATDGIEGNEFNQYSFFKNTDGELFFGGIDGLTIFNPKDITNCISANNQELKVEYIVSNGEYLDIKDNFTLKAKYNNIQFKLFYPDYKDSQNIQYAYKLSNVDSNWIQADNRNYATYTNLSPGKYNFKAMARGSSGKWSKVLTMEFEITPPLWKTPIAYLIYISIGLILLWIIYDRVNLLNKLVDQRTLQLNNKLKENEQLYEQLLKHEKYKNNYFINLSHELRTPLNIINSVQALVKDLNRKQKELNREKIDYYMDAVKTNSDRLLSLINNIINTSKIETGHYKLEKKIVNIVYLVENVAISMKELIESKELELIVDPQIEEKYINCDKDEIEKVIINLIANAIKFTEPGGKIEVLIYDLCENVKISVKDSGKGIDKKYHKSIFNRFDQAYGSSTEEYGGSGLGLTLSKQLIELHGGFIYVESEVGIGSEFIIILPVNSEEV